MTDVGSTHISHIETGMTIPSTKLLVQMMNLLDCDPAAVMCMEIRRDVYKRQDLFSGKAVTVVNFWFTTCG